ncbi:hypothetical protein FNV43_RR19714 [Rhamnella rubrinervis]|uniref:PB1 domain-containing protein n=1 Tax=Rhamnella rubrinervis TaxID=2594499 RepID=A0A8K0GTJ7_9ROSA|nr:hypothetical protein FNV43_RR19714 [Rhamnella rubrinervis]
MATAAKKKRLEVDGEGEKGKGSMEDSGSGNNQGVHSSRASDSSKMKVKVLCFSNCKPTFSSKGGLQYGGGKLRLVRFRNDISYDDLRDKMFSLFGEEIGEIRYYLPGHGLVSLITDEDVENMMEEFHELNSKIGPQIFKVFVEFDGYFL